MLKTSLPIDIYIEEIIKSFNHHDNLILTAPPGTGKTTRVPAALLKRFKKIIVLVPKRIAAASAANRVADENNWVFGKQVGYQVRFENKTDNQTRLIFMTEGIFIKKLQDSQMWHELDLIIFDEFHERSSLLDLALGFTLEKQILEQNIKIMVMSATLDIAPLEAFLQSGSKKPKHINVVTPIYPLEVIKSKKSQRLIIDTQFVDQLIETLHLALHKSQKDILIFLPGLSEINFVKKQLHDKFKNLEINILHGSMLIDEQKKILLESSNNSPTRRLILSTNIAESSLTIPSIDCVIDSGLVKKSIAEVKIGFKKLEVSRISLFSAKQRAGRAARTGPGICFQLWHALDERSMPPSIQPEVLTSDLLEESITLLSLGIQNPDNFSWLDKPTTLFKQAIDKLQKWGLVNTEKGRLVQSTPLDIEKSFLFIELSLHGMQKEASTFLAFLETTNFEKLTEPIDLEQLKINDLGYKIKKQLTHITIPHVYEFHQSFKHLLIRLFFKNFPNKIAKRKEKNIAISSLGRGVELPSYLQSPSFDYFLLLSGREYTNALTKCDFAIGFTTQEFEKYSTQNIQKITEVDFDFEAKKMFKIEKTIVGYFVISTASKTYINEIQYPDLFNDYFKNNFSKLLSLHPHYKSYLTKISFLKKQEPLNFNYLKELNDNVYDSIVEVTKTIHDFFDMNLYEIILFSTPENVVKDLQQLPTQLTLPNGKTVLIDYESEHAPKISARIQDLFGQTTNPTLLYGRIRITVELLAPNYRPTQITSQLENFWKTSYFEIKKELKARYPKHPWPDDPCNYIHTLKK